jgi:bifunctional DNase/RNase
MPAAAAEEARVRIESVEVRVSPVGPVVLLKVRNKAIPVFVDAVVAESIQGALTGKKTPRPLTHDLMRTVLEAFDGKVTQVVVTLKERTFYAALTVTVQRTPGVRQPLLGPSRSPYTSRRPSSCPRGSWTHRIDLENPQGEPETRT